MCWYHSCMSLDSHVPGAVTCLHSHVLEQVQRIDRLAKGFCCGVAHSAAAWADRHMQQLVR